MTEPETVSPNVRDLGALKLTMEQWLGERMPQARALKLENFAYPLGAGMSHETILFDAHWQESGEPRSRGMVVRIKPTTHLVYLDDMFDEQYRIMSVLHADGRVRVAETLWLESDAGILGAPFFVMEKCRGQVAVSVPPYTQSGWLFDASPEYRRKVWHNGVTQLGLMQTVPLEKLAFLDPPHGPKGFDHEWDRWRRMLTWISGEDRFEFLERAGEALAVTMPDDRPVGLVWGDARLGNMMIDQSGEVAAVMDWEQTSLGGPLNDLAWWLHHEHLLTDARGVPRLEGMGSREETIALWSEVSGKSVSDMEWYEPFTVFKMCCLGIRTWKLNTVMSRGFDPVYNPGSLRLASLLDIAPPEPWL